MVHPYNPVESWEASHKYMTVVCELQRICKDHLLLEEIERTVVKVKQVVKEAWHVALRHILRCIDEQLPIPQLDQQLCYWCCVGVLAHYDRPDPPAPRVPPRRRRRTDEATNRIGPIEEGDEPAHERRRRIPAAADLARQQLLDETIKLYRAERAQVLTYRPVELNYHAAILNEAARMMKINVVNYLAMHFEARLRMYIRIRYYRNAEITSQILRGVFRYMGHLERAESYEVRDWLGVTDFEDIIELHRPTEAAIRELVKRNIGEHLLRTHEMLQMVEVQHRETPKVKGIRLFSLLPQSKSHVGDHIKINGRTLHGLCARIFQTTNTRAFDPPVPMRQGPTTIQFFQNNRSRMLRRAFKVTPFETSLPETPMSAGAFRSMNPLFKSDHARHLFADQVTTDGFTACILLWKPCPYLESLAYQKLQQRSKMKKSEARSQRRSPLPAAGRVYPF